MAEVINGLKDALEYVVNNSKRDVVTFKVDGNVYATEKLELIGKDDEDTRIVKPLQITTLNGFIDYVKENRDSVDLKSALVQVTGPSSTSFLSVLKAKNKREYTRDCFITSNAELPQIPFGRWQDIEDFMIMLQSSFESSPDRETLMKYVGNIKEDESVMTTDDGVSQKIVAHTGVASVDTVILPNPVKLRPYRTFQELEQPESEFVLRIRKGGGVALFEADGGAWKVECRARIKAALVDAFRDVEGICVIG